jgi:hypothetical protein
VPARQPAGHRPGPDANSRAAHGDSRHAAAHPEAALALPIERRTINTLRRAGVSQGDGEPWTVGRYLEIPRFGGRALVDLLAAFEARVGVALPSLAQVSLADDRALRRLLLTIARRLPIAENQLDAAVPWRGHSSRRSTSPACSRAPPSSVTSSRFG